MHTFKDIDGSTLVELRGLDRKGHVQLSATPHTARYSVRIRCRGSTPALRSAPRYSTKQQVVLHLAEDDCADAFRVWMSGVDEDTVLFRSDHGRHE
jgi:hypothetical protein